MFIPVVIDYCQVSRSDNQDVVVSCGGHCEVLQACKGEYARVAVERFIGLVGDHVGEQLVVYTSIRDIAALVDAHAELFGNVTVSSTVTPGLADDFRKVREEVRERRRQAKIAETCDTGAAGVVAATDASMGCAAGRAGIAMVSTTGLVEARVVRAATILDAEFEAVLMALMKWVGKAHELHVLTDSLYVFRALNRPSVRRRRSEVGRNAQRKCCQLLFGAVGLTDVHVHWVRGHTGHPLNEIADEVAMFTRRNGEWGLGEAQDAMVSRAREALARTVAGRAMIDFVPAAGDRNVRRGRL